ncbi:DUF4148 domain-containing protein [Paraburkholderia sp. MMS20-SJTN17]|uniref:DUF4148 domain-containing protein n=1 Tax=Paraburkholderia translucens TaxID=2886945 RepID=A0ABS8KCA4_9BURK|nr:DUF4148 domain-containing protein [Paraburkholderia sp. MMS20-SJTN17]MCC8402287.1 DUF4148 domain-containing protein [Paraburkholderia sp. MMS20-SJTN17]
MRPLVRLTAFVAALAFAVPITVFAAANVGANHPLTRAEVREQLVEIEAAGYNPARANPREYPADIQAAEAKVAAQHAGAPGANGSHPMTVVAVSEEVIAIESAGDTSGVGGVVSGASAAGAPAYKSEAARTGPGSVYFGH